MGSWVAGASMNSAKAVAPVVREQSVPMLAFTTDRSVLGAGVWSLGYLPGSQVKRLVTQALADNRQRITAAESTIQHQP